MPLKFLEKFSDMFKDRRIDVAERFELLREAISGTMSSFYMARDRKTGKTVGLKILDPEKTEPFKPGSKGWKNRAKARTPWRPAIPRSAKTPAAARTTSER